MVAADAGTVELSGVQFTGLPSSDPTPANDWLGSDGTLVECTIIGRGSRLRLSGHGVTISNNVFRTTDGYALHIAPAGIARVGTFKGNRIEADFGAGTQVQGKVEKQGGIAVLFGNPLHRFEDNRVTVRNGIAAVRYRVPEEFAAYRWDDANNDFFFNKNQLLNVGKDSVTGLLVDELTSEQTLVFSNSTLQGFTTGAKIAADRIVLKGLRLKGNRTGLYLTSGSFVNNVHITAAGKVAETAVIFGEAGEDICPHITGLMVHGYPQGISVIGDPVASNYLREVMMHGVAQPLVMKTNDGDPLVFPSGASWLLPTQTLAKEHKDHKHH